MHWVNFPVLFTMIWSGLLIYWNDSDNAYQHPHAVYRVGVGSLTLVRMFPPWFWKLINAPIEFTTPEFLPRSEFHLGANSLAVGRSLTLTVSGIVAGKAS